MLFCKWYWRNTWQPNPLAIGLYDIWEFFSACWHQHRLSLFMTYSFYMVVEYRWNGKYASLWEVSTIEGERQGCLMLLFLYIQTKQPSASVHIAEQSVSTLLIPELLSCRRCSWLTSDLPMDGSSAPYSMYLQVKLLLECRVDVSSVCVIFHSYSFYFLRQYYSSKLTQAI